jgi:hypothetical protein
LTTNPYLNTLTPNSLYLQVGSNSYFANSFTAANAEQVLLDALNTEVIQDKGMDVYYIRRKNSNAFDQIYEEDPNQTYVNTYTIEVYLETFSGYAGQGEFFSKLGLEVRDEVVLDMNINRFKTVIGTPENLPRPQEADLIYIPIMKDMFEITFVDHRKVFYQIGQLYMYQLKLKKFELSSEHFATGIPEIDTFMANNSYVVSNTSVPVPNIDSITINPTLTSNINSTDLIDFSEENPFGDIVH